LEDWKTANKTLYFKTIIKSSSNNKIKNLAIIYKNLNNTNKTKTKSTRCFKCHKTKRKNAQITNREEVEMQKYIRTNRKNHSK
jgi:hypothetical protein